MSKELYSLLDAIREEKLLLDEFTKYYKNASIMQRIVEENSQMLNRILNRFDKGYEYYIGMQDGNSVLKYRKGTSHLEREYPAVAKAKHNLEIVTAIVKKS